jgi:hypothetical protein
MDSDSEMAGENMIEELVMRSCDVIEHEGSTENGAFY